MRRIACAIAGLCLLTAAPALAQTSLGEKSGVNSLIGITPSTADFVKEAAISDMFEIQSSRLALQKSSDAATKTFAQQMVTDHTKTTSELKSLIQANNINVTPPTALDPAHQRMIATLNNLSGADFDKQYHDDQMTGHKDAVSLFQRYAKGGDNAALKDWAGKTLPILQHHLDMAEVLDK